MTKSGALSDSGAPGNDMAPHFQRRCFRAHKARAFKPTFSPTPVLAFRLSGKTFAFANFLFRILRYSANFTPAPLLSPSKAALPGLIRSGFIGHRPTRRHNLPTITANQDGVRRSRRGLYLLLHWTKSSALPLRAAYMFSSPPAFHQ